MIPDTAWTLVPTEEPRDLPPWMGRLADAGGFSDRERRAYVWAMWLLSQVQGQAFVSAIVGLQLAAGVPTDLAVVDVSAGFIPHSLETLPEVRTRRDVQLQFNASSVTAGTLRYSFGVVIGVESPTAPRPERSELPSQLVSIEGFPVVAEFREITHSAPPNPSGAMAACYVRPRTSKRFFGPLWSDGIVIARHSLSSLGFTTGVSVPMASGVSLTVSDIDDATTIDAAILDCRTIPSTAAPLLLAPAVAVGDNVSVRTGSGGFTAQVLRICDHPSYFGNMVAHRVFLDTVGSSGDSGSLVTRTAHGDCAGLYMGTTGGATPEGLVQSMRQVVQYFDVDLFD